MQRFVFSIGHHSNDPGAVANNTTEHNEVKALVNKAVKELAAKGINTYVIPVNLTLVKKIQWVNYYFTVNDFLLSVHLNAANSSAATGISTWFYGGDNSSKKFAKVIQYQLIKDLSLKDRGVKSDTSNRHGRLGIIRDSKTKAWLVELGFISNYSDLQKVRTKGLQALVNVVLKFFSSQNPFLKSSPFIINTNTKKTTFSDVMPQDWCFSLVEKAYKKKIMKGFSDGTFKPNNPLTRAELLAVLNNLNLL